LLDYGIIKDYSVLFISWGVTPVIILSGIIRIIQIIMLLILFDE